MRRIRVGCGEITQVIHIPALHHLSDLFEITALCDVSPVVLEGVARQCGNGKPDANDEDLVRDPDIDAVLAANPHAFRGEVAAMESGKDLLADQPMCMTLADADALAAAGRRTGRTAQVGNRRRHAGAFLEALDLGRAEKGKVRCARVQDILGGMP